MALAGIGLWASFSLVACDRGESVVPVGAENAGLTIAELDIETAAQICANASAVDCFVPMTEYACANGGCPRAGYARRIKNTRPGRLEIHETLDYLQRLRNAAATELANDSSQDGGVQDGDALVIDRLYQQVQMMLRNYAARYYGAYDAQTGTWPEIPRSTIFQDRTVDPARFHSVTFVNGAPGSNLRTAHAMTQADFGRWLVSVAVVFATWGRPEESLYYLRLSQRVFASFGIPAQHGGVRNDRQGYRCLGATGPYCYWFHSQPAEDYAFPSSPLNQNLHAIRDALEVHHELRSWREFGTCQCKTSTCAERFAGVSRGGPPFTCSSPGGAFPTGTEFDGFIAQLHDWGRGGLLNLAFGQGNAGGNGPTYPPPNLTDFLIEDTWRASYGFWVTSHPGYPRGQTDISAYNNCHYHYHSLTLAAGVFGLLSDSAYLQSDTRLINARRELLYGNEAVAACTPGASYIDAPLWKFVMAARYPGLPFQTCVADAWSFQNPGQAPPLSSDGGVQFERSKDWKDLEAARAFYEEAYCQSL